MTHEQSDTAWLTDYELDDVAAKSAPPIAAAFAAAGWAWASGWSRDDPPYVPDAAELAVKIRRKFEDVEVGKTLSSGRVMVSRYIDECGDDTVEVWLHVATCHGKGSSS